MHHRTDRITHTTALVTPVMENWLEIAQSEVARPDFEIHNVICCMCKKYRFLDDSIISKKNS